MVPTLREQPRRGPESRLSRVCGLCKHPGTARPSGRAAARTVRLRSPHGNHVGVRDHPLIIHNTKAVLDQWGSDGWELVQVVTGPDGNGLVAYLKRPTGEK